jgi:signal transduction histidine kinase
VIGILMLLHGKMLLVPDAVAWTWLTFSGGLLFLLRRGTNLDREYLVSMVVCTVSVLGWVAIVEDPMSSLVSFCNLIFITVLILTVSPRAGLGLLLLNYGGLTLIRSAQHLLHLDLGIAPPPRSWIQGGQVGVIFLIHYISIWYLVNLIWLQQERNIEARKHAEAINANLIASEKARSVFLSTVTHELRTPLTNIHGYVDLMIAGETDRDKALVIVKRAAVRLQSLTDEFLDLADAPSLAKSMNLKTMVLNELVGEEIPALAEQAKHRGIELRFISDKPALVLADRLRLAQVVTNLVNNALQHSPKGALVTVSVDAAGDSALLKVEDNGAGIAKADLPLIFNPLFSRESVVKKSKGKGLGLAICKQIIEATKGSIEAKSEQGHGSLFTVRLPLVELPSRPELALTGAQRALVLDDDPDILALMQATLAKLGYEVIKALDGAAALEAGLEGTYHLMILDINVPELSGIEVSRRLRQAGSKAKVFLFSALPDHEADAAVGEARADGFIAKPFEYEKLIDTLRIAGVLPA